MRPITTKDDAVRSQKLRDAPKDYDFSCVACDKPQDGSVVLAHLPGPGDGGKGYKTDDYFGAHLCYKCHGYADGPEGRRNYEWRTTMLHRTLRRLVQSGLARFPA